MFAPRRRLARLSTPSMRPCSAAQGSPGTRPIVRRCASIAADHWGASRMDARTRLVEGRRFTLQLPASYNPARQQRTPSPLPCRPQHRRSPQCAATASSRPRALRPDPYYWLRDDTRSQPEVLAHLAAENAYTEAMLAPLSRVRRPPVRRDRCQGEAGRFERAVPLPRVLVRDALRSQGGEYPLIMRRPDAHPNTRDDSARLQRARGGSALLRSRRLRG